MILRLAVLLACLAAAAFAQSDLKSAGVRLKEGTTIPLRLPSVMPDLGQGSEPLYAVVESATPSAYTVILAYTPDCNGASVCRAGTLSARRLVKGKARRGKRVALAGGISGVFRDATCGANCSDSVITWTEGNIEYTAGVKAGSEADVVKLANAALNK